MTSTIASFGLILVTAGQSASPNYPSITTKKNLYAANDIRGKMGPKVVADEWLKGTAPVTKGKVVIVDFWATWCPPCRETIPELNAIAARFPKDVVVIGLTNETAETVKKFMSGTKMTYSVGVDAKDQTGKMIGVQGIPHVIVMSPDGIVRWQGFPLDATEPLSADTIAKIIAASKASTK